MSKNTKLKWIVGSATGLALVAAGAATGYALYYADRALPNTTVAGQPVAGMGRGEIVALVERMAGQVEVTSVVNGQASVASLSDLGVSVDARATADAALAPSDSVLDRFAALFSSNDVVPRATRDQAVLDAYSANLARAAGPVVKDAAVKLEGTSFVAVPGEVGTQAAVTAALEDLAQGRTVLVIAHRLSTIRSADRIAVIAGGRVEAVGTHDELYAAGGTYRQFWDDQSAVSRWRLTGGGHS